jgi:hypothetical protein
MLFYYLDLLNEKVINFSTWEADVLGTMKIGLVIITTIASKEISKNTTPRLRK